MRLALRRSENGDNDLHAFILNRTAKALEDLIETTWMVQDAPKVAERESKSRIGIIEETAKGTCQCKGEWLRCAKEVLSLCICTCHAAMFNFWKKKKYESFVDRTYKLWQIISAESH